MGAVSSIVFGARNTGLGVNDPIREPVAMAQVYNATFNAAHSGMKFISDKAQNILDKVDDLGNKAGVQHSSEKIAKIASKAVNPLLIAAAGYRVYKDEDKKSALIEETMGMGAMFGTEKAYKTFRNTVQQAMGKEVTGKTFNNAQINGVADKFASKLSKVSGGKNKLLFVVAELGFVMASIGAYMLGNTIGKKVTGRYGQDSTQNNAFGTLTLPNNEASSLSQNNSTATA